MGASSHCRSGAGEARTRNLEKNEAQPSRLIRPRDQLTAPQLDWIVAQHHTQMQRFGYLP
jgi:hypothetical protein